MLLVVQQLSLLTRALYLWIVPFVRLASQRQLKEDDLRELPYLHSCTVDLDRFNVTWNALRQRTGSLFFSIIWTFRARITICIGLSLCVIASSITGPLLLASLLKVLDPAVSPPVWFSQRLIGLLGHLPRWAYPLACSLTMVANSVLGILLVHRLFFIQPMFSRRVRALLTFLVFDKVLKQDGSSRHQFPAGMIINTVASDITRIDTFFIFFHSVWHHPLTLAIVVVLLYNLVGVAALWGCLALLIIFSASLILSRIQANYRRQTTALADSRVGLTRETLLHIKAAKLQGWENQLAQKIQHVRTSETACAQMLVRTSALLSFLSSCAPAIAVTVTTLCLFNDRATLELAVLFPMLSLFTLLKFAMSQLPETIHNLVDACISLERIKRFLNAPEFKAITVDPSLPHALDLSHVVCVWPSGAPALKVDKLTINRGELVVVVGSVGAGKSSLLRTILGEIHPHLGEVRVGGSTAYLAQNPWIVSDSIRNNISCGLAFDADRYKLALDASGLLPDLRLLPNGDQTQIGERGINLSGGQRHRVALARALYNQAEIYLFDDPLSALDPQVANYVFDQLINRSLASKTRVLVSHRVEFALAADRVLVVENGEIVEQGNPRELQVSGSRFSELLHYHEQMQKDADSSSNHKEHPLAGASAENDLPSAHDDSQLAPSCISPEERLAGAVQQTTARRYLTLLAPGTAGVLLIGIFLLRQFTSLGADLWLAFSTSNTSLSPATFVTGYLVTVGLLCLASWLRATYTLSRGLKAGLHCHRSLLDGVLHAPMRFFESNPVGRILNRFSRDLETVEAHLPRALLDAGVCVCESVAICAVIGVVAPPALVVIVLLIIVYYSLLRLYRPISRDVQRLTATALSPVFATLSESLSGVETIRAARLTDYTMKRFTSALDAFSRTLVAQMGINRWLGVHLELLGTLVILTTGVLISLHIDSGAGAALSGLTLTYAASMTGTLNWAVRSIAAVEVNLTSFERIESYAQTKPEATQGISAPAAWPSKGDINFEHFSARYRPELPECLSDISCTIRGGMRVGIIGRTGSGKSSLILSLMRILEASKGRIVIDGVDISQLRLEDLRTSVAVVPQEPVLFSGTLRESLDPFEQHSDDAIYSAIERVRLWPFFSSLPHGLATVVHEGGFNFSCGQRQLICLARALLRNNRIIVLDEATASIDVQTDFAIQRAIREEFSGATVLVVAHRLGTILDSDFIVGLREGSVVEAGSPTELLSSASSLLGQFVREAQSKVVTPLF